MDELKIKQENVILSINKPFIQLTMKANGKADLYFHAYFWEQYLKKLNDGSLGSTPTKKKKLIIKKPDLDDADESGPLDDDMSSSTGQKIDLFSGKYTFMRRLVGLSSTLSKVIVNIKKFPFHEKMYQKYAKEFGQR